MTGWPPPLACPSTGEEWRWGAWSIHLGMNDDPGREGSAATAADADTQGGRAERREEIKLRLEYAKLLTSLFGLGAIAFGVLQWQASNIAARQTGYQRMTGEWREHLSTFVEKPELRPYFTDRKELTATDPNRNVVLAVADIRLDVMDGVLTYAEMQGVAGDIGGWRRTFVGAFSGSSVLCSRLQETRANFGLVVSLGECTCNGVEAPGGPRTPNSYR